MRLPPLQPPLMTTRRRFRSAIKWTGTIAAVLLLVVWIGSGWYGVFYWKDQAGGISSCLCCVGGEVCVSWDMWWRDGTGEFWVGSTRANNFRWWFSFDFGHDPATSLWKSIAIPLWFPMLLVGVPTALMCRTDRKRRRMERIGLCPTCGYDLLANPSQPCPECGKKFAAENAEHAEK